MTLHEVCQKHGIRTAHLAQTMGVQRQSLEQCGKRYTPTAKTLIKASKAFRELGVPMTPQKLFAEMISDREDKDDDLRKI